MFPFAAPAIIKATAAILKPQDVFAILAQPANAMQAAINALPFQPDLLIGKDRLAVGDWSWRDSLTGLTNTLASNTKDVQSAWPGYSGTSDRIEYAFKRQSGVFDRLTWAGNGAANRQIPHGLGVVPGLFVIKKLNAASNIGWLVFSLSLGATNYMSLNQINRVATIGGDTVFPSNPTKDAIVVGGYEDVNLANVNYAGYVFAHDPSVDGIVQCGVSTANASGVFTIPHGWTGGAQWVLFKRTDNTSDWIIADAARTAGFSGADALLRPNTSAVETSADQISQSGGVMTVAAGGANGTYIWAIIRAPY